MSKRSCLTPRKAVVLGIVLLWSLFPLYWLSSLSVRTAEELKQGAGLFPRSLTLDHLAGSVGKEGFLLSMVNSLGVSTASLAISICAGVSAAYILGRSRFRSWIHRPLLAWVLVLRILPPVSLAIPLFILFNRVGLLGTPVPIVAAHTLINLPFVMWFMVSSFRSLPRELEESAVIDGAGELRIYASIALPLSAPSIAAVSVFAFMNSWNEYLFAVIFVQKPVDFTLPLRLATMNSEQELLKWGELASGGLLSLGPLLVFAVFMQKYLVSGLTAGAIKE